MNLPTTWTAAALKDDAAQAKALFRRSRLDEPSEQYSRLFQDYVPVFRSIIDALPRLAVTPPDLDLLLELLGGDKTRTAFRYLAAPPISEDDLKTLAETTLAPSVLRRHPERALRVRDTVLGVLDRHRFPWIADRRLPSAEEVERATLASAALLAARRVETLRRSDARAIQEARVKDLLRNQGLLEVPKRDVPLIDAAPAPGEFCAESKLGDTRADILVRLYDRRLMPIECKVSNSAVNSFKRVNHEAAGKARKWLSAFGTRQIVPAAVLSGVFNPANLEAAQMSGLFLFWNFRLEDLAAFVATTKPGT